MSQVIKISTLNFKLKKKRVRFLIETKNKKSEIPASKVIGIIIYQNGMLSTSAIDLANSYKIPIISFYNDQFLTFQPPNAFIDPILVKDQIILTASKRNLIVSSMINAFIKNSTNILSQEFNITLDNISSLKKINRLPQFQYFTAFENTLINTISKKIQSNCFPALYQTLKKLTAHEIALLMLKRGLLPTIPLFHPKSTQIPLSFDLTLDFIPHLILPLSISLSKKFQNELPPLLDILLELNSLLNSKHMHPVHKHLMTVRNIFSTQIKSLSLAFSSPIVSYVPFSDVMQL